ncbi:MAG: Re/Si-specific NAD(P)(+) transhydrogenase subunit alpha [Alphaproteobacteria bacterium]
MKVAVLKERRAGERRVAASPDTVAKLVAAGVGVVVETGAGDQSALLDSAFKDAGATIGSDPAKTLAGADLVLKVQRPMTADEGEDEVGLFKKGQILICHLNARINPETTRALAAKGVTLFAMELMPRISRAQSMDILSSQGNISGYKAVLDALEFYGRAMPMMSTAAGRVSPANAFIMGVGVAGLQAIATARRLGAVVYATDVRPDTKEQVESLAGKFVAVEDEEFQQAQTEGGYAKEMSDAYKKKQAALIAETLPKMDIVITTALIPGRPAPVLVTEDHVKSMKPGSVIVDLAAEAGGNCPLTEPGKVVQKHGVTLIGHGNWPSRVPETTSRLFAQNLLNFLNLMIDKDSGELTIDTEDKIIADTLVVRDGNILLDGVAEKKAPAKKAKAKKSAAKKTSAKKASAKKANATKDEKPADTPPSAPDADESEKEA